MSARYRCVVTQAGHTKRTFTWYASDDDAARADARLWLFGESEKIRSLETLGSDGWRPVEVEQ